uniref:ABC transporter domain-containing protein n=1 Tax=Haemonchus placei TaxID=6290 RepID=A0A0N4WIH7_HAEPC
LVGYILFSRSQILDAWILGVTISSEQLVSIQWKNVKVETKSGRQILQDVSGIAVPREMIALMGASGTGKTTLLNTLLQRNLGGLSVEGTVLVNGQNIGRGVTNVSAYVQQEDLFVGTLTVTTSLRFPID